MYDMLSIIAKIPLPPPKSPTPPAAARVGDLHTCPMSDGSKPHVGGPVAKGSGNVFIEGMPAARVNDAATCCGPVDTIKQGSPTVLINGKCASRVGDATAHGGKIVLGAARTHIGNGKGKGDDVRGCFIGASRSGSATISRG